MHKFFSAVCLTIIVVFSTAAFAGENHQKGDKQYNTAHNAEKIKYRQQKQQAEAQRQLAQRQKEAQRKLKKQQHEAARQQLKRKHAEAQQQKKALQDPPYQADQQ